MENILKFDIYIVYFLWGINFIRLFFSASQSPLGKTGHVTFEKEFSYLMQCFVASCEGSGEISKLSLCLAPFVSFQMSLTFIVFSIHSSVTVTFTKKIACFLNKVFIDIHCILFSTIKGMASITDVCVSCFCFCSWISGWATAKPACPINVKLCLWLTERVMMLNHWPVECWSFPIGHCSFNITRHEQSCSYIIRWLLQRFHSLIATHSKSIAS